MGCGSSQEEEPKQVARVVAREPAKYYTLDGRGPCVLTERGKRIRRHNPGLTEAEFGDLLNAHASADRQCRGMIQGHTHIIRGNRGNFDHPHGYTWRPA
jgi:hypothetical protein